MIRIQQEKWFVGLKNMKCFIYYTSSKNLTTTIQNSATWHIMIYSTDIKCLWQCIATKKINKKKRKLFIKSTTCINLKE